MSSKLKLVEMLNDRQYRSEVNESILDFATKNELVIVYGASDDLIVLKGSIDDEFEAWRGTEIRLDISGTVLEDFNGDEDEANEFPNIIQAFWCAKSENGKRICSWTYETNIPHEKFEIFEDDELYCIGFVFNINDLA